MLTSPVGGGPRAPASSSNLHPRAGPREGRSLSLAIGHQKYSVGGHVALGKPLQPPRFTWEMRGQAARLCPCPFSFCECHKTPPILGTSYTVKCTGLACLGNLTLQHHRPVVQASEPLLSL